MQLEKDCKLIERSLNYYVQYMRDVTKDISSKLPALTRDDLAFNIELLDTLERKVCLATETEIIKNNKMIIIESLQHYCKSLEGTLEKLQNEFNIASLPFDSTQKEIDECKKLLECLS